MIDPAWSPGRTALHIPAVWEDGGGGDVFFVDVFANFTTAADICAGLGGILAEPASTAEALVAAELSKVFYPRE